MIVGYVHKKSKTITRYQRIVGYRTGWHFSENKYSQFQWFLHWSLTFCCYQTSWMFFLRIPIIEHEVGGSGIESTTRPAPKSKILATKLRRLFASSTVKTFISHLSEFPKFCAFLNARKPCSNSSGLAICCNLCVFDNTVTAASTFYNFPRAIKTHY